MKIQTLNNNFLMGGVFFVTALFSHFAIADTTDDTTARVIKNSDNIAKNKGELDKAKSAVEIMADRVQRLAPLPHNERPQEQFMWLCKDSDYPQWGGCEYIYKVGDTGPAGGIVYYITDDGQHGLEVGLEDLGPADWGCDGTAILKAQGDDALAVGRGKENTDAILAGCSSQSSAAYMAYSYSSNGIEGWHLPSLDSLNLIFEEIYQNGLGEFNGNHQFWSSSEYDAHIGMLKDFDGGSGHESKSSSDGISVRPVRPF